MPFPTGAVLSRGVIEGAGAVIDVTVEFTDFDAFWLAQTPSYAPTTRLVASMSERERARLIDAVRERLQPSVNGGIAYGVRANAVRGRVPS
jgi:hypothetical protein